jgi:hypothetical protein
MLTFASLKPGAVIVINAVALTGPDSKNKQGVAAGVGLWKAEPGDHRQDVGPILCSPEICCWFATAKRWLPSDWRCDDCAQPSGRVTGRRLSGQVICTCAGFLNSGDASDQCCALIYPDNIDMDTFIRVYSPYDLHGFRGYSQDCGGRDG